MVRGWVVEQVNMFIVMTRLTATTHVFQMLEFKTASVAAAAVSHAPTTYKAILKRSTLAISSGLNRLFGTPTSGGSTVTSVSGQSQEREASIAGQRSRARLLGGVHRELEEYLEEPLESFSRIERVNGIQQTVVFDVLTYWQVRTSPFYPPGDSNFTAGCGGAIPKPLLPRDGCPTRTSKFCAMRAALLVREGDPHRSPKQNPAKTHGGPASSEIIVSRQFAQHDRALIGRVPTPE